MKVYIKYNQNRNDRFCICTEILKKSGDLIVLKSSASAESKNFLDQILCNYEKLNKSNFSIKPVGVKNNGENSIVFDYMQGETLESLLLKSLRANNPDEFIKLLNEYKHAVLDNAMIMHTVNADFIDIFGEHKDEIAQESLRAGIFDLNFDNIIRSRDKSDLRLIDYEWMFDFPMPVKYIFFRALVNFYAKFFMNYPNRLLPLNKAYELFGINDEEKNRFKFYDLNFIKYFSKNTPGHHDFMRNYDVIEKDSYSINFNTISHENNNLKEKIINLEKEVIFMRESKFWKARDFYCKLKNNFLIKKD